jgi:hypothetical protein
VSGQIRDRTTLLRAFRILAATLAAILPGTTVKLSACVYATCLSVTKRYHQKRKLQAPQISPKVGYPLTVAV